MRYRPGRAMNHLQNLPGFDEAFNTMLYKRVQQEADDGCHSLTEFGPSTFDKEALEGYSVEEHYDNLCSTFPTAMTVAAAIVTKEKSCEAGVKVTT